MTVPSSASRPSDRPGRCPARALGACLLLLALAAALPAQGQPSGPLTLDWSVARLDAATARALGPDAARLGGAEARLLLAVLTPAQGWHTYAHRHPGPGRKSTAVTVQTAGTVLPTLYPPGAPYPTDRTASAYAGPTPVFIPLPGEFSNRPAALTLEVDAVLCRETRCAPTRLRQEIRLTPEALAAAPGIDSTPWGPALAAAVRQAPESRPSAASPEAFPVYAPAPPNAPAARDWSFQPRPFAAGMEVSGLAAALALGLLAGLILNVMPCVLPVAALKLAPLMARGQTPARREVRIQALYFGLGIECSFLALAGLLAASGLAWGEMFQEPAVVLTLALVIFALGLSLFGVFHLPVLDLRSASRASNPRLRALLTGMLATLLATPCSGPLLGGVLSWTLSRPAPIILLVLAGVGAGMALPYAALALWPGLARWFPRPGAWTGLVEKAVGLFLMGTCLYLLLILPPTLLPRALAALLATAAGAWIWGLGGIGLRGRRAALCKGAGALLTAAALVWALAPPTHPEPWEPFHPESFTRELGSRPLLVDFTADWCPTCQALQATVLTDKAVAALKDEFGIRALRADLTENFPAAEALLRALNARSIPALAIFPTGEAALRPMVLRDLFTPGQLRQALLQCQAEGRQPLPAPGQGAGPPPPTHSKEIPCPTSNASSPPASCSEPAV